MSRRVASAIANPDPPNPNPSPGPNPDPNPNPNPRCANALAVHRKLGKAALFITITTDLKDWPEVSTRTTSC